MAKKKSAKTNKTVSAKSGLPEDAQEWFNRLLPNLAEHKGMTVPARKANAQRECKDLLRSLVDDWKIVPGDDAFEWTSPQPPDDRFKLKVWIMPKRKTGGSGDPPIPAPRQPPPSM
jgi:hypothetical protein